jgi:hypothetical protein
MQRDLNPSKILSQSLEEEDSDESSDSDKDAYGEENIDLIHPLVDSPKRK